MLFIYYLVLSGSIISGQASVVEFRALQKELAVKNAQRDESLLLIKVLIVDRLSNKDVMFCLVFKINNLLTYVNPLDISASELSGQGIAITSYDVQEWRVLCLKPHWYCLGNNLC